MKKKLTIDLEQDVYDYLHTVVGRRRIGAFIESLVWPHVLGNDLDRAYRPMAQDQAREAEPVEWSEGTMRDVALDG